MLSRVQLATCSQLTWLLPSACRYEHVAHEEAEKQLVFSQANLFGHRTATEAYARSVARRQDMNQAFFANQDPEVRYSGLGKFGRNAEAPSAGRGVLRVPFGTDA